MRRSPGAGCAAFLGIWAEPRQISYLVRHCWHSGAGFASHVNGGEKDRPRGGAKSGQWRGATRHGARGSHGWRVPWRIGPQGQSCHGRSGRSFELSGGALAEPIAIAVQLKDVDVVCQPPAVSEVSAAISLVRPGRNSQHQQDVPTFGSRSTASGKCWHPIRRDPRQATCDTTSATPTHEASRHSARHIRPKPPREGEYGRRAQPEVRQTNPRLWFSSCPTASVSSKRDRRINVSVRMTSTATTLSDAPVCMPDVSTGSLFRMRRLPSPQTVPTTSRFRPLAFAS